MKPEDREPVSVFLYMIVLFAAILLVVSLTSCSDDNVVTPSVQCYERQLIEDTYLITPTDTTFLYATQIGETWNTCSVDTPSWWFPEWDTLSRWLPIAGDTVLNVYCTKKPV